MPENLVKTIDKNPGNCEKCEKYEDDLYDCLGHYFCDECGEEIDMYLDNAIDFYLGKRKHNFRIVEKDGSIRD